MLDETGPQYVMMVSLYIAEDNVFVSLEVHNNFFLIVSYLSFLMIHIIPV